MHKKIFPESMVLGCGNVLLGDDGFGPAVIAALRDRRDLPPQVACHDVGTGVREHLFNFLLAPDLAPRCLILVDAVDSADRAPAEVFLVSPAAAAPARDMDRCLHQGPTVELLCQLAGRAGTRVHVIAARAVRIPALVEPGLSPPMQGAVRRAAGLVLHLLSLPAATSEAS